MDLPRTHPLWLVLFILLAIAGGVGTWYFRDRIVRPKGLEEQLEDERQINENLQETVAENSRRIEAWRETLGFHTSQQVKDFLNDPDVKEYIQQQESLVLAMEKLSGDIRNPDEGYINSVKTLYNNIADKYRQIQQVRTKIEQAKADYEKQRQTLIDQADRLGEQADAARRQGQKALADKREAIQDLKEDYRELVAEWEAARPELEAQLAELQAAVEMFEEKLVNATGFRPPADGRVLTIDYDTGQAIVDMGSENYAGIADVGRREDGTVIRQHREIKPNMVFDIYGQGKGDTRAPKAQLRITAVNDTTSQGVITTIFESRGDDVIPREANPENNDVVPGDFVEPRVHRFDKPRFAVVGWFSEDARYGRAQLEGLARQWGGEVMETAEVTTDYVVLGEIDPAKAPTEAAKARAEAGARALDTARKFGVTILTVDKFLDMIEKDVSAAMTASK
jgi:hypothetical protein